LDPVWETKVAPETSKPDGKTTSKRPFAGHGFVVVPPAFTLPSALSTSDAGVTVAPEIEFVRIALPEAVPVSMAAPPLARVVRAYVAVVPDTCGLRTEPSEIVMAPLL